MEVPVFDIEDPLRYDKLVGRARQGDVIVIPVSTAPAIVGRVATSWMLDNAHSFSKEEFCDQS